MNRLLKQCAVFLFFVFVLFLFGCNQKDNTNEKELEENKQNEINLNSDEQNSNLDSQNQESSKTPDVIETNDKTDDEEKVITEYQPLYDVEVSDDSCTVIFENIDGLKYLVINQITYEIKDNIVEINNLDFETEYSFKIVYDYLDNELELLDTFTTLPAKEIKVSFPNNTITRTVTIKKGEVIEPPISAQSIKSEGYMFFGWTTDLWDIKEDTTVYPVFKQLEEKNVYKLSDIFYWIDKMDIDKIDKIIISFDHNYWFDNYEITDINDIKTIFNRIKEETIELDEDFKKELGGAVIGVSFYYYGYEFGFKVSDTLDFITLFNKTYVTSKSFVKFIKDCCKEEYLVK